MNTTVVGTSQAAAHGAGLAAYLLSASKDLTPATVGKAITTLAVPRPPARSASGQPNLLAFNRLIAFEGVAGD
ncbi:S8 family serine peptidase [Kitasatospora sp. NBC_00374]|uniref:S8 family serine peptidase n=1 Tax=Kitasatospora sp. NBC_00374 TaxID=2975964 RepID=UPI00352F460C